MEETTITLLKNYLTTMEHPPNITKREEAYLKKNSYKFIVHINTLYRFNPEVNSGLKKVLSPKEAKEAIVMYHHHPLGGHFAYSNT